MIHIIDDEEPMRDALAWLFKAHRLPTYLFSSSEDFLAYLAQKSGGAVGPSCIILDIRMLGSSGTELFSRIQSERLCPHWPVIFLTGHGDIGMAVSALKSGAFDFVEKPFSDESLVDRVHAALSESAHRLQSAIEATSFERRLSSLTPRELEVMTLIVEGNYNKVIADRLGIVPRTVEFFRARIFEKMDVKSAVELASLVASHSRAA